MSCVECQDRGEVFCPDCYGYGKVVDQKTNLSITCLKCKGRGTIPCPRCKHKVETEVELSPEKVELPPDEELLHQRI